MSQQPIVLVVLGALAVVGLVAAATSGRRAAKRAVKGVREVNRMTAMAFRVLVAAGVITGIQWAIVSNANDIRVIVVTLAVPALLAGASVARMLAVTEVVHSARRGGGHR
jgi:hypothetical protein